MQGIAAFESSLECVLPGMCVRYLLWSVLPRLIGSVLLGSLLWATSAPVLYTQASANIDCNQGILTSVCTALTASVQRPSTDARTQCELVNTWLLSWTTAEHLVDLLPDSQSAGQSAGCELWKSQYNQREHVSAAALQHCCCGCSQKVPKAGSQGHLMLPRTHVALPLSTHSQHLPVFLQFVHDYLVLRRAASEIPAAPSNTCNGLTEYLAAAQLNCGSTCEPTSRQDASVWGSMHTRMKLQDDALLKPSHACAKKTQSLTALNLKGLTVRRRRELMR
jgi:hypothetical protein